MRTQDKIRRVCSDLAAFLCDKNRKYGDSAISPARIFSTSSAIEQLNVRIDDKINRIRNRQADDDEDAELDLIGYLILKRVVTGKRGKDVTDETPNLIGWPEGDYKAVGTD